jgi:hypothetical protein
MPRSTSERAVDRASAGNFTAAGIHGAGNRDSPDKVKTGAEWWWMQSSETGLQLRNREFSENQAQKQAL